MVPPALLAGLGRECSGKHVHEEIRRNDRAAARASAAYPEQLCDFVAERVVAHLSFEPQPALGLLVTRPASASQHMANLVRTAAFLQPRGRRAPELLPEFSEVVTVSCDRRAADAIAHPGRRWPKDALVRFGITAPAMCVRVQWWGVSGAPHTRPPTRTSLAEIGGSLGEGDLYVGRAHRLRSGRLLPASPWGNPFRLSNCVDRADCVNRFRSHLFASPALLAKLPELLGRRLVCHCSPRQACHADVLIEAVVAELGVTGATESADGGCAVDFGLFASPAAFVAQASECEHPFAPTAVPEPLAAAAMARLSRPPSATIAFRTAVLKYWTRRAAELADDEAALKKCMPSEVAEVMSGKRLLVFGEMLEAVGFPNAALLLHHLTHGFPVTGAFPETGVFPRSVRSAEVDEAQLLDGAAEYTDSVCLTRSGGPGSDLDEALYQETLSEVEAGFLVGPFSRDDLNEHFGDSRWLPARRFAVRQGPKIRAIDDFAANHVNRGLSAVESITPVDIDGVAGHCRFLCEALHVRDDDRLADSALKGFRADRAFKGAALRARLWDLSKAYRQLAAAPEHARFQIVFLVNPSSGRTEFFRMRSLAFGASSSVFSFNWLALALSIALQRLLHVSVTNFYDDYTVVEAEPLVADTGAAVDALFGLLGWCLKETPELSEAPEVLGAVLDLSKATSGRVQLRNKPSRTKELLEHLASLRRAGSGTPEEMRALRGRLLFARGLCFGRFGGQALRSLSGIADASGSARQALSGDARVALDNFSLFLDLSPPRVLDAVLPRPVHVFTDGSFEADEQVVAGMGAILLDPVDRACEFFGCFAPAALVERWMAGGRQTAIMQAEVAPVVLARLFWHERLRGRPVVVWIDNEGAKASLVKGGSSDREAGRLAVLAVQLEIACGSLTWYARVPSESNPADAPSRGRPAEPLRGWRTPTRVNVDRLARALADDRESADAAAVAGCDPRVLR